MNICLIAIVVCLAGTPAAEAKLDYLARTYLPTANDLLLLLETFADASYYQPNPEILKSKFEGLNDFNVELVDDVHYFLSTLDKHDIEELRVESPRVYALAIALNAVVPKYHARMAQVRPARHRETKALIQDTKDELLDVYLESRSQVLAQSNADYLEEESELFKTIKAIACVEDDFDKSLKDLAVRARELLLAINERISIERQVSRQAAFNVIEERVKNLASVPIRYFVRYALQNFFADPIESKVELKDLYHPTSQYKEKLKELDYEFKC